MPPSSHAQRLDLFSLIMCLVSLNPTIILILTFDLKKRLLAQAIAEGFSNARITKPDTIPEVPTQLGAFLKSGFHGQMEWMETRQAHRGAPKTLWPEVQSVLMLAESYAPGTDPLQNLKDRNIGNISVYARGKDYHDVVKKRLKRLARWLVAEGGGSVKVFVDTAPVAEKPLAQAAGLGWQGKHTNLVSKETGNWMFLGSIFTTLELEPDQAETDHCGNCTRCLDVCPTNAFVAPYKMDARRCISYLTIEHKGPVDHELRSGIGNHIYGCDDCLAVCPWNKFAVEASDIRYAAKDDLAAPRLQDLLGLTDKSFREKFSGSPIKRIGRDRFVRNVLYAVGNSFESDYVPQIEALLSDQDPTIVEAAAWAKQKIILGKN
jgi:epoxyqueuosine reductase